VACGFTNNVDYVVRVDGEAIGELARGFGIGKGEAPVAVIESPRACLAAVVGWLAAGRGGEIPATDEATLHWLVERFSGRLQVGGTGAQAARTLGRLGFRTLVHLTSLSPAQAAVLDIGDRMLAATVAGVAPLREAVRSADPTMYHVIFEYRAGCRVELTDGAVVAPCDNRIIVAYDLINRAFAIDPNFVSAVGSAASGVERVLVSGFSQLADRTTCGERIGATLEAIAGWRRGGRGPWIHLEIGSTPDNWLLRTTLDRLGPAVDSIGLNAEELALALEAAAEELAAVTDRVTGLRALQSVLATPRVGLHTWEYCLTVTRGDPAMERRALIFASLVAGARARLGEFPTLGDLRSLAMAARPSPAGLAAERRLIEALRMREGMARLGDGSWLVLAPAFDVGRPAATVGLGDSFTAGLLAMLPE
jgi:ADP-dependent phosphofructokinase/glucokinase